MTTLEPGEDHPEAITLGLHDASPRHLVAAMADDVVLELGWGRLIFGQTFADPEELARVLRQEAAGPGVGEALTRALAAVFHDRDRPTSTCRWHTTTPRQSRSTRSSAFSVCRCWR
jgi:hypothetical protein